MQTSIFNREPRPCILARLACPQCGPVRMALAPQDEPLTTLECPYCFEPAKAERLGIGLTVRELPYFEFEAKMDMLMRRPPQLTAFRRLSPGQLVVYCQEMRILHLASVGDIHTSRAHLSPEGLPSISFEIGGERTAPAPHVSASGNVPPFWCLPEEVRAALGVPPEKKPAAGKRRT